jgi:hypothetical protein
MSKTYYIWLKNTSTKVFRPPLIIHFRKARIARRSEYLNIVGTVGYYYLFLKKLLVKK